jgi:spore coat protein CotH
MVPHLFRGIALAAIVGAAWPASAQTPADLFDDAAVQDVRIYLHSADWRALQAGYLEDTYYPADLLWRGVRVGNVGVRSRGFGTRSPIKPGLKIDVNRFVSGQRFLGLRALVLDNGLQDDSLIKERLAFALFQRLGVDVPREAPARLYVNNVYWGAYVVVEAVDDEFLQRVAPAATVPYLFEYRWVDAYGLGDLGDDVGAYATRFEPRTHETDAATVLYGPIRELTRRLAEAGDDGDVEAAAAPYLDLDQFVRVAAVENFIADIDGLLGAWGMNNFYLYRPFDSARGRLVPWDKDVAFHDARHPLWAGVEGNVLMRGLLRTPRFRTLYLETLQACAAIAAEPTATDARGWLEREVWRLADGIAPSVSGDRRGPGAEAARRATERLAAFAAARAPIVLCDLAVDRGETTADVCAALPAPDPEPPPR